VPSRDLRNDTAAVLRKVQDGDDVVITQDDDFDQLSGIAGLRLVRC
jgi:hypothetical protein